MPSQGQLYVVLVRPTSRACHRRLRAERRRDWARRRPGSRGPRPGLVASPGTGREPAPRPTARARRFVVELHTTAPAQDHVHLLLLRVRVAVRKAIAGRNGLVAQAGLLELERLGRRAELEVRRAVELGADVLQILLDVPERERHGLAGLEDVEPEQRRHKRIGHVDELRDAEVDGHARERVGGGTLEAVPLLEGGRSSRSARRARRRSGPSRGRRDAHRAVAGRLR